MNRGIRELVLLAALYVGYSASRLLADDAFTPAAARALQLLDVERVVWLDVEGLLNGWFVAVPVLGLVAQLLVRDAPLRRHRGGAGAGSTAAAPDVYLPGPHGARGRHDPRAGALPDGADGAAAAARRLRRRARSSTPARAGGAATPRPRAGSAGSPTSSRRSRRCTPAGRSGSRSSYAATCGRAGCAAWRGPTPPAPRSSSSAPATTGCSTPSSAGSWSAGVGDRQRDQQPTGR